MAIKLTDWSFKASFALFSLVCKVPSFTYDPPATMTTHISSTYGAKGGTSGVISDTRLPSPLAIVAPQRR